MEPSSPGGMVHYFILYCMEFLKFVSAGNEIMHDTLRAMCDSITNSLTNYLSEALPPSTAGAQTQTGCLGSEALAEVQDLKRSLERYLKNMEHFIKEIGNGRNRCDSLLDDRLLCKMDKAKSVTIKLSFPQPKYSSERRKSSLATSSLVADCNPSNVNTSETKSDILQRDNKHSTVSKAAEEETTYDTDLLCPSKVTNSRDKSRSPEEALVGPFDTSTHKRKKKHKEKDKHHSDDSYITAFDEDSINVSDSSVTQANETSTLSSSKPKKHKKHKRNKNDREFSAQDQEETPSIGSAGNADGAIAAGKKEAANANLELAMLKQSLSRISEPIYVLDREFTSEPPDLSVVWEEESEESLVENSEEEREQTQETKFRNQAVSSIGVENQACNDESSDTTITERLLPKNAVDSCIIRLEKEENVKGVPEKKRGACSVEIPENGEVKPEAISYSNINVSNSTANYQFSNIESSDPADISDQANILTEERHAADRGTFASAQKIKETCQESKTLSNSSVIKILEDQIAKIYAAQQCATAQKCSGDESERVTAMRNACKTILHLLRDPAKLANSGFVRTKTLPLEAVKLEATILPVDSKKCNLSIDTCVRRKGGTEFDKNPAIFSNGVKDAVVDSHDTKYRLNSEKEIPQESYNGMSERVRRPCSIVEAAIRRKANEISEETTAEGDILMPTGALGDAVVKDIRKVADMDDDEVELELGKPDSERFILMKELLKQGVEMKKMGDQLRKCASQCKETETSPVSAKELRSKPKTPEQIYNLGHKCHSKPNENEASETLKHCASEDRLKAKVQLAKQSSESKSGKDAVEIDNTTDGPEACRDMPEEGKSTTSVAVQPLETGFKKADVEARAFKNPSHEGVLAENPKLEYYYTKL